MTTRTAGSDTKPSRQCPPLRTATRSLSRTASCTAFDHLLGRPDETNVVGLAGESLVESPSEQIGIAQVVRSDLVGSRPQALW